jgi:citrate lyase subunit beta/citryl-CoA lyase
VLALVESAVGLCRAEEIAAAEGVVRMAFGAVDYQRDLGLTDDELGLDHPRSVLAVRSRAAGLPAPVDGPVVSLGDEEALAASARRARVLGMGGKFCIHPGQVATVNAAFSATAAEVEWARRIVGAADVQGEGVLRVDGQMVDRPVVDRARRVLRDATA